LKSFRKRKLELLNKHGPVVGDYPESVRTTWSMNFRQLEKESEAAADLLRLNGFLSPDNIPLEFLSEGAPEFGDVLSAALVGAQEDPLMLDETLTPMGRFSLIRRDIEARSYSIHRLVQAVVRGELDPKTHRLWAERAVRAVNRVFPYPQFSTWAGCERFLSQAQACAELINQWGFEFAEAVRLLNAVGFYLSEHGRYTDAEATYQRVLAIQEKTLGSEHPDVANSVQNLAVLYHEQGQYRKAEPLYERARATREKALGPEHPQVAQSIQGLAGVYRDQGQYEKGEPLYGRARAIWEKALGPEHPQVAGSLSNLAVLYRAQGRHAEAEPLFERARAIREKVLGPEHPHLAWSVQGLAVLYYDQGQYQRAEPLFERVQAIREKALSPEHPDLALSLQNLAALYCAQGRYAEAEPLFGRARAIWEKALGPEHPDLATSIRAKLR
jgi:tetratricopeptide (TPR) repeat protein